jgi:hypothetical protein
MAANVRAVKIVLAQYNTFGLPGTVVLVVDGVLFMSNCLSVYDPSGIAVSDWSACVLVSDCESACKIQRLLRQRIRSW